MKWKAWGSIVLLPAAIACGADGSNAIRDVTAPATEIAFRSPGFPESRLDSSGRLLEDWGAVELRLDGPGLPSPSSSRVERLTLSGKVPAARAVAIHGPVRMEVTAFRGPAWPTGFDVMSVRVEETAGKETPVHLKVALPESVQPDEATRTVRLGGRIIVSSDRENRTEGEWGYVDPRTAMPGWARPEGVFDPAFRNIRAGMGGVPLTYRFRAGRGGQARVALGFCESHHAEAGQRMMRCDVEGAPPVTVDPIAKWGRHRPGVLLFEGRDTDGDGTIRAAVLPEAGSPDMNSILNAIWLFPPDLSIEPAKVVTGEENGRAFCRIDVGGAGDGPLDRAGFLDYRWTLPPNGSRTISLYVACPGSSAPIPDQTGWTPRSLFLSHARIYD